MCFLVKGLGGVFVSKHTPESSKDIGRAFEALRENQKFGWVFEKIGRVFKKLGPVAVL